MQIGNSLETFDRKFFDLEIVTAYFYLNVSALT